MSIILYGISNCDTIKKAKKHLDNLGVDYSFHDYRKHGLDSDLVAQLEALFGWQTMVNKRGTTYRQLSDEQKQQLDKDSAMALMVEHPALIKRPILRTDEHALIGYKAADYDNMFAKS